MRPVAFQQDQVSDPSTNIAIVGAAFWGVIPFIGDAIAIVLVLVGGIVHLFRRSKQKRRDEQVLSDATRPWEWAILARGPDPDSAYEQIWVSGGWVSLLGLRPTANGSAWLKGIEATKERANAKATRAYRIMTDLIR